MPKVSEIYPDKGKYLKATDLTQPLTLTVTSAEEDKSFDKVQIVMGFAELDKKLRLNSTNAKWLREKYGDEAHGWVGKRMILASVPTTYQGKTVAGLRIIG